MFGEQGADCGVCTVNPAVSQGMYTDMVPAGKHTVPFEQREESERLSCKKKRRLYRFAKRAVDIICSLGMLILLFPFMSIVALLIFAEDRGPILYCQYRVGQDYKIFKMYKFRSMYRDAEERLEQLKEETGCCRLFFKDKNDPRITAVGRVIRKYNIDELPQLINILAGDMSLVGPRPLPTYEAAALGDRYPERYQAPPGLTCYWQVSDRTQVTDEERMEMDVEYTMSATMQKDLTLIGRTIITVFKGRGEY